MNGIKAHKVKEAKRVYKDSHTHIICIHLGLFNRQVAHIRLDPIKDDDVNFATRQQVQGRGVFTIDQNFSKWHLLDKLPTYETLELKL